MNQSLLIDGFRILPHVLSSETISKLAAAMASLDARHGLRNLLRNCPAVAALAEELKPLVTPLLGNGAFPARGLFFDKIPGANWEVGWHQDLSIAVAERVELPGFGGWSVKQGVIHVQPPASVLEKMLTLRVHLDDCDSDNGPLRVLRGSHRHGRLNDDQIAQRNHEYEEVTCVVSAGGVLLMQPLILHASSPAKMPRHRRVIHLEYAADPLPAPLRWFEQPGQISSHEHE
jgi:ectoine hydroxylase-related dioxygenase (phytanoyl-CoA dioxygenase family)